MQPVHLLSTQTNKDLRVQMLFTKSVSFAISTLTSTAAAVCTKLVICHGCTFISYKSTQTCIQYLHTISITNIL